MKNLPPELDALACPLDESRLIEASAGTGKTWTIVSLVLRLVLERRLDISRILVVTFTEAATAELRERIRTRIAALLAQLDAGTRDDAFGAQLIENLEAEGRPRNELRNLLVLALDRFDEAAIFTIHGFCRRALADAAFASAQPFALELVEDDSDVRHEVVADFWRRHVAGGELPPALLAYLRLKCDSPEQWSGLLALKQKKPLAQWRWPEAEAPVPATSELEAAFTAAHGVWRTGRDAIVALLLASLDRLHGGRYKVDKLEGAFAAWDAWFATGDALTKVDISVVDLLAESNLTVPKNKAKLGPPPAHSFFALAQRLLDLRTSVDSGLALARLALLRRMVEATDRDLRARKREARIVAFDDLLWNLYERLHADGGLRLAVELRRPYDAALLDEFQDTDPVQFAIFNALFGGGERPWFLVGDPKQAIYGFRNADVHAYLAARSAVQATSTLAANQRATPGLIRAMNALFGANSRAFVLDAIDYVPVHSGARTPPVLRDPAGPQHDFVVWTLPFVEAVSLGEARAAAVNATAAEIARLLAGAKSGEVLFGERPLAPLDIAVLVRSHRDGQRVRDGLAALGIGCVELGRQPLFATGDAEDLARVLAAIAEPARGGLVRAALATVILGWDAGAIDALADGDDGSFAEVTTRFAVYRQLWLDRGVGTMLRRFVVDEQVIARLLMRDDGERRLVNLRHLGEVLQEAGRTLRAPDALLHWLATQQQSTGTEEAWQLRLESDRNLVRIVTVHKAKGLEFPVTFCPLLFTSVTRAQSGILQTREYHEGATAIIDARDDGDEAIKQAMRIETAAEDARLQYVALTRAIHRTYLVAGLFASGSSSTMSARAPLNWLVAGEGTAPQDWFATKAAATSPEALAARWERLATTAPGAIAVRPIPATRGTPLPPPTIVLDDLAALRAPAHIAAPWRIASFSSLVHGATRENAASDHDARALAPGAPSPIDLAPGDILRFPRGRSAGDCLHAVFEYADFADRATWPAAIASALRDHPQPGDAARLAIMATSMLADVTATPMPGGFALGDVPRGRRLSELEFQLPAPRLAPAALQRVLGVLDADAPRLAVSGFGGFVHGFIDLVFEHGGRWYLADWKSNYLGATRDDYASPALAAAMREHGYHLQYLLYSLALERFLRHRLAGYAFEQHFGGVLYLFVRGVRPGWPGAGIFHDRPSAATLAALEDALGARAA